MALTVDQLVAARDALLDAQASGVRELRDQNGEIITYKGDREMIQATGRAAPTTLPFRTSKGTSHEELRATW